MKNLHIAIVLCVLSTAASADAFAPWDARAPVDVRVDTTPAVVAPPGFAPWRDRVYRLEMPDAVQLGAMPSSVFRPWS